MRAGAAALGALPDQRQSSLNAFLMRAAACSWSSMLLSVRASIAHGGSPCANGYAGTFNFELQAAATDNGIVISLGEQHSFPLDVVFEFLDTDSVRRRSDAGDAGRPDVHGAMAMECVARPGVLRFSGGRKVRRRFSACDPTICWRRFSRIRRRAAKTSWVKSGFPIIRL